MKKCMLIALITIFTFSAFGAACFAKNLTMANTSKKGSLLVFPLIQIGLKTTQDTIISISNDYPTSVHLKCFYRYPSGCPCDTFSFSLTGNQELSWHVKNGLTLDNKLLPFHVRIPPFNNTNFPVGELKCWAVDVKDLPISWNWLSGEAIIGEDNNETWEYSAWRFAVGPKVAFNTNPPQSPNQPTGTASLRLLGQLDTYDACPSKLMFDFIEQVSPSGIVGGNYTSDTNGFPHAYPRVDNVLTLVPCKQDCVNTPGNDSIVRADLTVYNEYENDAQTFTCLGCGTPGEWLSNSLSSMRFHDPTVFENLFSPNGVIVVDNALAGSDANDCIGNVGQSATGGVPLLGVMRMQFSSTSGPLAGEAGTAVLPAQGYINNDNTTEVAISYRP